MTENNLNPDNYDERKVAIKVAGARDRTKGRKSNYTVIVPYTFLNQALGQISRTGGKIIDILVKSSCLIAPIKSDNSKVPSVSDSIATRDAKPASIESTATSAKEVSKTDTNNSEIIKTTSSSQITSEPTTVSESTKESAQKAEDKIISSPRKRSKKTRLTSSKKLMRNSSKSHSTKARRRAKTYLQ